MGLHPERFSMTLTNYGRRAILDVKRGDIKIDGSPIKGHSHKIIINFRENVTRKPKRK